MKLKENNSIEKLRGVYYTPKELASAIINKLIDLKENISILEPSCGDGVFIETIFENDVLKNSDIDAIEINAIETEKLSCKYKSKKNIKIINQDFFEFHFQQKKSKYDLIIGNPPYIRYQYLDEIQRKEMSEILVEKGMKSNKLINAWVGFTVACSSMLSDEGTLAFVIPAEILQVVYAQDLRLFLSQTFNDINIITFQKLIFQDIEQEIVVLICKKTKEKKGIRIIQTKDVSTLNGIELNEYEYQDIKCNKEKWTKYFTSTNELEIIENIRKSKDFCKLSDVALINVGITTGNNSYFSLDKKIIEQYKLQKYCIPLIGKSCQVHSLYFNKKDILFNYNNGKKSYLLAIDNIGKDQLDNNLKKYIKYGERIEANTGYKCSIRDNWYSVPSIWVPDAFFARRNGFYPKFILNNCKAVSTDTMHRLKFKENINPLTIILSYYNSISLAFTEIYGRSYGGGVLEILPSEVGEVMVPNLDNISMEEQKTLLKKIDSLIRKGTSIEKILDFTDPIILVNNLGYSLEYCNSFRNIWRKLQQRRLNRNN